MRTGVGGLCVIVMLAACASGGSMSPAAMANREMCEELKRLLFEDHDIRSYTIYPRCEPGLVVLNGTVRDFEGRAKAARIARSMPGVRNVQNNLRILDESEGDTDIRY